MNALIVSPQLVQPADFTRRRVIVTALGASIATLLPSCAVPTTRIIVAVALWAIEEVLSAVVQAVGALVITAIVDNLRQTISADLSRDDYNALKRGGKLFIRTLDGVERLIAYTIETAALSVRPNNGTSQPDAFDNIPSATPKPYNPPSTPRVEPRAATPTPYDPPASRYQPPPVRREPRVSATCFRCRTPNYFNASSPPLEFNCAECGGYNRHKSLPPRMKGVLIHCPRCRGSFELDGVFRAPDQFRCPTCGAYNRHR